MMRCRPWLLVALLALGVSQGGCAAAPTQPSPGTPAQASPAAMDAELLYQLLLAELQRRHDPGAAYSLVLDAAKRTQHPQLYRRAVDIALSGRAPNAALDAARAWLQAHPADDDAHRIRTQLLAGLQRTAELGPAVRAWLRVASPERRRDIVAAVPALLDRAADANAAVDAARTALQDALRDAATAATAQASLGAVLLQAGRHAEALLAADEALRADPTSAAAALLAVELAAHAPVQAAALVQRHLEATAARPDADPTARLAWAQRLARQGELPAALAVLDATDVTQPDTLRRVAMLRARLLRDADQVAAAYDALTAAAQRAPDDADLGYELALTAERLGRHDEAERLLRALIERRPEDPHAYNALGYSLAERGIRLDEAKALILEAVRRAPNDGYILDSLGWVEFRLGNTAEARRWLTRAMELKPDAEIAAHLGEVLWTLGERDEARRVWRQGLELDARNRALVETLRRLGVQDL
ncbi:tetratricopeptide repeat protein [Tepidimonas ignava]|uniref:Beta-barrel assembly-enhancing protease n=1 Tax=Tepidimonas ignava TaxID=114249 RepID=A0A4R3LIB8_9BURK|nr:tetratricopeptide repeat protein [Tepidimonas ignava]TCS97306.1 tetratricopeptide repeat protein [Tepidimonas ignava]TSE21292.1 Beta-barrel assembly-enhancing protease [Tepidimonas ignava]